MKFSFFIVLFGTIIIAVAFLVAISFAQKDKPKFFRYIYSYLILGMLISANTIVNNNNLWLLNMKFSIFSEQLFFIAQFLMTSLFFRQILRETIYSKRIKIFTILSILIQLATLIIVLLTNIEFKPVLFSCLFSIIFCYFYVKNLMLEKPTLNLLKSSSFWIVIGILYPSCIGFPVHALIPFIPRTDEFINIRGQIFSITNISLIVMYMFIIKSYLCLKHPQNS